MTASGTDHGGGDRSTMRAGVRVMFPGKHGAFTPSFQLCLLPGASAGSATPRGVRPLIAAARFRS